MSSEMGSIHLIIGCMFSGKTSELIRIIKRYRSINKKVMVINYEKDTRYGDNQILSHDKIGIESHMIDKLQNIFLDRELQQIFEDSDLICINEGQFFPDLIDFCQFSCNKLNKIVYVCGLDGDYRQKRFGDILDLIPCCESVTRLSALCKICGNSAHFTKRINKDTKEQILIGSGEDYIPVCRYHYFNNIKQFDEMNKNNNGNIKDDFYKMNYII